MNINISKLKIEEDGIYCPQQVLAELFGMAVANISQLTTAGVIESSAPGRNNLLKCVYTYVKHLKGKADGRMKGGTGEFVDEKARLTKAQADMAEMEALEMSGEMVRRDEVVQEWQGILMDMKAKILSMPSKAATLVADEDSPAVCQQILDKMIREALQELSEYAGKRTVATGNVGTETASETDGL
jgi:phage terminase Nu1 subunit (DNA packaging protein)